MKISLIIPVYNAADHLEECLKAVTSQDYPDYEVVVVDDCSTDNSREIVGKYPVRVVVMPVNSGASAARNAGVQEAKADYLVLVDSDVVLAPDSLTRLKQSHDLRPDMAIIVGVYSENSAHLGVVSDYKNLDLVYRGASSEELKKYAASYCISLYKNTYLEAGGFDETLTGATAEDIDFGLRVCKGERLVFNDRSIAVDHLKRYSLWGMLRTNYYRLISMARIRHTAEVPLEVSSNSSIEPILNLFLPMLTTLLAFGWLTSVLSLWPLAAVSAFFLGLNMPFFNFLRTRRGSLFMVAGAALLFVEYFHAFISLCMGFIQFPPPGLKKVVGR
ncbi:glycosyltransferase family 2 protein [Pseudodesulfovibrio sp.]|nr:glycosyltransferase family 2 protein [Pseudodesulfovibrio sp.]